MVSWWTWGIGDDDGSKCPFYDHVWLDFLRYVIGKDGARGLKEGFRGT